MSRPTAILVEDEPLLLDELRERLATLWPELTVLATATDGAQAFRELERHAPDIVFLDIHLPEADGLEVARQVAGRCHVVFVTAYAEHAIEAFEQGAIDYVMKPISAARLAATVARLRERLGEAPARRDALLRALADAGLAQREYLRWISATSGRRIHLITCKDICYFQADNKLTAVVTAQGESLVNRTIRQLSAELDPASFFQIHRGIIVNIDAVALIEREAHGVMHVRLKQRPERLPVSASFTHLFRNL
jgi:DNA-binding LytR/AlgR family response regulator